MATASSLQSRGRLNAFDNVAVSATDSVLVAAAPGKKIRVHGFHVSCGATPSDVNFNSKGSGAGTAISPIYDNSISSPEIDSGWFETARGEGLTVTTGSGSTTGVIVVYSLVH